MMPRVRNREHRRVIICNLTVRRIKLGVAYATDLRFSRTGMVARPNT